MRVKRDHVPEGDKLTVRLFRIIRKIETPTRNCECRKKEEKRRTKKNKARNLSFATRSDDITRSKRNFAPRDREKKKYDVEHNLIVNNWDFPSMLSMRWKTLLTRDRNSISPHT